MIKRIIILFVIISLQIFSQTAAQDAKKKSSVKKNAAGEKVQRVQNDDNSDAATAVEIPGGVLFGKFSKDDGPFLFKGNIIVPAGQTLEFGPGVKVFVGGEYTTITVFGEIKVKGTPAEPVIFQSAKSDPKPWDWDRIYCRSRNRSTFEHCIIRHSNYGIFVENGSVVIKKSLFEKNSLHGLVVKNSDALISSSTFQSGHVLAIFCQAGADVQADSIMVRNNITGIACAGKSYLKMDKGVVKGNTNGIAVKKNASVIAVAVDFTKNQTGIVTEWEISKRLREMVFNNIIDFKLVTPNEMEQILKPPQAVKSLALPNTETAIRTSGNFQPGFSALRAPRESYASFIGNVTGGLKYFRPVSSPHPKNDTIYPQTKYSGEIYDKYPKEKYVGYSVDSNGVVTDPYATTYPGYQPELVIFAQGKRGLLDVNLNTDLYYNQWIENGLHLHADLFTMSINYADISFVLGDFYENSSETSIYSRKLRGMKLTGNFWDMGRGTDRIEFKLAAGESERKKDIGEHEVEIFGDTVDTGFSVRQQLTYVADLAIKPTHNATISFRGLISHDQDEKLLFRDVITDTAVPDPVSAQTGCIDADLLLLDGKLEVSAELDLGVHDTVKEEDFDEIAWYKPQALPALQRVFGLMGGKDEFLEHFAFLFDVEGGIKGVDLKGSYMEIAQDYFSAGNPYLEPDRRVIKAEAERQFNDQLFAEVGYEYERTSASNIYSKDSSTVLEALGTSDSGRIQNESPTDNNTVIFGGNYSFGENKPLIYLSYAARFQNKGDQGSYYEVTANDTLTKYDYYDYDRVDNSLGLEVKQRFLNGINYSIKYRLINKNDYSTDDVLLVEDEDDSWENIVTARFGFKIKRRLRNKTSVRVKYKTEVEDDSKKFEYKISNNLRVNIVPRKLTLIMRGEYRNQNEETDTDPGGLKLTQVSVQGDIKYTITSRLSALLMVKYEDFRDDNEASRENYTATIAGIHLTYLF